MKVGIITMHKVLNYGSALQAYATQWILRQIGFESELIDYEIEKPLRVYNLKQKLMHIIVMLRDFFRGFPQNKKKRSFEQFYVENYILTNVHYSKDSILANPPSFDVYMTGSDQVWNPRFVGNDVNFMLAFAPKGKPRISFASSFATDVIDKYHQTLYGQQLKLFDAISVREQSGVEIVKLLTGKDAVVCCDPTMLLSRDVVSHIASRSTLKLSNKYVLVYGLHYMFDPYPYIYRIVNHVCTEFNCNVVYLDGRNADLFKPNSKVVSSAGPSEFLWLFEHAEFVITTSFHGTVFSLVYDKPFFSVVDKQSKSDSRITSLCRLCNAERSLVDYRDVPQEKYNELISLNGDNMALAEMRSNALNYLKTTLVKYDI